MIKQLTVESQYGLVTIVDPANPNVKVPVTGSVCTSTGSCVAVPVRPYVDGPVSLWLGPMEQMPAKIVMFEGSIDVPSGRLAIDLPEGGESLEIEVAGSSAALLVCVDDLDLASQVWVGVQGAS